MGDGPVTRNTARGASATSSHSRRLTRALFRRSGDRLLADHAVERAPRRQARDVVLDIDQCAVGILGHAGLLRLEHRDVLEKNTRDLVEQQLRRLRVLGLVAVGRRPEIEAALLGLGGRAVVQAQAEAALLAAVLLGAVAGLERTGPLEDRRRRDILE